MHSVHGDLWRACKAERNGTGRIPGEMSPKQVITPLVALMTRGDMPQKTGQDARRTHGRGNPYWTLQASLRVEGGGQEQGAVGGRCRWEEPASLLHARPHPKPKPAPEEPPSSLDHISPPPPH